MALRIFTFILLCVISGSVVFRSSAFAAQGAKTKNAEEKKAADQEDILEAVFRYQFSHNDSFIKSSAGAYYLSLGGTLNLKGTDVSDEFLKRFDGNKPSVLRYSEADVDVVKGVTDKRTGVKGLIFEVRTIEWVSEDEVKVEGGYYENGTSSSGEEYTVKREGGKWVVKSSKGLWIS
jgi:hypothetical protein